MAVSRFSTKKIGIAIAAVVIIVVLVAYTYMSTTAPKIPNLNSFIYATAEPMTSLDPHQTTANTDYRETYLMYDRLVTYRGSSTTPELLLAKSYEVSTDGLIWTFHLREGIKFHDGTPLDANAVAFSFARGAKIGLSAGMLTGIIDENSVKALDTSTVQFTLKESYSPFLATLGTQAFSIVSPKVMEHEVGGDLGKAWLSQNEAGSGPFALKEYVPNEKIVLSAVKDYWGGAPKIDEFVVRIITEGSTQRLMLERGEIDGAEAIPTVAMNQLKNSSDFHVVDDPSFAITFLILNTQHKPLSDVRVRKALACAIDYDGIIRDIMFERAVRLRSSLPAGFPGADLTVPLYNYDLTMAKSLLAEAGYSQGFELNMLIAPFEDWIKIATSVQSELAKLNIKVNIQQFAWPTYIEKLTAGDHDIGIMGWTPDYADPNMQSWFFFYSGNAGPGWNFAFYNNTRIDQLLLSGRSEADANKRQLIYNELQKITVDEVPYIWVSQGRGYGGIVLRSWVQGYVFNPLNAWFIPADQIYKAPP
jgi:peptide/nickel transport system substrate-binding protein